MTMLNLRQHPYCGTSSADERASALRALFDFMRKGLAVECDALDRLKIESLAGRMRSLIKAPWILDEERFLAAPVFMPRPPTRREIFQKDEELILRGSPTSTIGRILKVMTFAGKRPTGKQITEIVEGLLHVANRYGLATKVTSLASRGQTGGGLFRILPLQSRSVLLEAMRSPSATIAFFRNCIAAFPAYSSTAVELSLGLRGANILLKSRVTYES